MWFENVINLNKGELVNVIYLDFLYVFYKYLFKSGLEEDISK